MDPRKSIKWGLLFTIILIALIAYGTTGTFNPGEVWTKSSTWIKIVLSGLTLLMGLQLLSLLLVSQIPEDAECSDPECSNKNIRAFLPVLKNVVRCQRCKRWYHTVCWIRFNKTEPAVQELMIGCKLCKGDEIGTRRLFNDDDIFSQRM